MNFVITLKRYFKNIDNFIILNVDGGLGSVILQYALGLNITKKTGKKVKFDTSWFSGEHKTCDNKLTQEFTIKNLFPNLDFQVANSKELKFYKKYYLYQNKKTWVFNDFLFKNNKPTYFAGYYSHYRYWYDLEQELQEKFNISYWNFDENNLNMIEKINSANYSVAIHIRRGDFLTLGWCCLDKEYYINAIKYIQNKLKKNLNLFFFSNDIEYVKKEIIPQLSDINYTVVDINNHYSGHLDLYLMSLCKAQIIANSSFSISSALLNKNTEKIIIAPNTWGYNIGKENNNGIYDGIEESIQNPNWTILNYKTGDLIREKVE